MHGLPGSMSMILERSQPSQQAVQLPQLRFSIGQLSAIGVRNETTGGGFPGRPRDQPTIVRNNPAQGIINARIVLGLRAFFPRAAPVRGTAGDRTQSEP
jgi:hypothetical protein